MSALAERIARAAYEEDEGSWDDAPAHLRDAWLGWAVRVIIPAVHDDPEWDHLKEQS